jgi:hypothetical protein
LNFDEGRPRGVNLVDELNNQGARGHRTGDIAAPVLPNGCENGRPE